MLPRGERRLPKEANFGKTFSKVAAFPIMRRGERTAPHRAKPSPTERKSPPSPSWETNDFLTKCKGADLEKEVTQ